jgi:hypothetical protein
MIFLSKSDQHGRKPTVDQDEAAVAFAAAGEHGEGLQGNSHGRHASANQ